MLRERRALRARCAWTYDVTGFLIGLVESCGENVLGNLRQSIQPLEKHLMQVEENVFVHAGGCLSSTSVVLD